MQTCSVVDHRGVRCSLGPGHSGYHRFRRLVLTPMERETLHRMVAQGEALALGTADGGARGLAAKGLAVCEQLSTGWRRYRPTVAGADYLETMR